MNSKKLCAKLEDWVASGLIAREQATAIAAYEEGRKKGPGWGLLIFAGFGAVALGLGVILLFAYNWQDMHKFAKLGVIFGALLLAHGGGLWLRQRRCPDGVVEAAHLLGSMLFGAGIFLIAQIYHISAHYPDAFLIWAGGALLLTWALPSIPQGLLAAVLLGIWACTEAIDYNTGPAIAPLLVLLGLGLPAWRFRSPVLLGASTLAFALVVTAVLTTNQKSFFLSLLGVSALYFALSRLTARHAALPQAPTVFRRSGLLLYLPLLFVLSFPDAVNAFSRVSCFDGDLSRWLIAMPLLSAAFVLNAWVIIQTMREQEACGAGELLSLLAPAAMLAIFLDCCWPKRYLPEYTGGWLSAITIGANLAFLHQALSTLWRGCSETRAGLVAFGSLLLAALASARFTDLFESLLARGMVFLLMAAFLFYVAFVYQRKGQKPPRAERMP